MLVALLLWLAATVGGGYLELQRYTHPQTVPIVVGSSFERLRMERYNRCELPTRSLFVPRGGRITVSVHGRFDTTRRLRLRSLRGKLVATGVLHPGIRRWRLPPRLHAFEYTLVVTSGRLSGATSLAVFETGSGSGGLFQVTTGRR